MHEQKEIWGALKGMLTMLFPVEVLHSVACALVLPKLGFVLVGVELGGRVPSFLDFRLEHVDCGEESVSLKGNSEI